MGLRLILMIREIEALYEIYEWGMCGVQMSEETVVRKYVRKTADVLHDIYVRVCKKRDH